MTMKLIKINKIPIDRKHAVRIEVVCGGDQRIEITKLGPKDPEGPGDIGVVPQPMDLSKRQTMAILRRAKTHPLVAEALAALQADTADFYGANPSASVLAQLGANATARRGLRRRTL
jgi:hypothetical protein